MNDILEPLHLYNSELKEKHQQLTEDYFDKLVKHSGVDVDGNARLMSERKKAQSKLSDADKSLQKQKSLRGFVIFCVVALFLGALIAGFAIADPDLLFLRILLPIIFVGGAVGLIVVICCVLNKKIAEGKSVVDKLKQQIANIEREAWAQMRPLNVKYDWNIPDELIYKTVPQIQLDKYFDEDKHDYFKHNFGLSVAGRKDVSVYCARSGNSLGNPFLLIRYYAQTMVPHTYTGTLTVSWTEHHTRSDGSHYTVTRTQTLVAHVTKPKPSYAYNTKLYYGNDAAPNLKFLRTPTVPKDADDKKIASMVKKGERQLEKKARKAVEEGSNFNKMANSEFEVLFGASNRDNETEFRLMFTPLAQQNMVALLRNKEGYGDDFTFQKFGKENIIHSTHGASLDINANPAQFVNFDLAQAKKDFIKFNAEYFKSIYFDFAPLLSIPIYQQERPSSPFGICTNHGNLGDFEMESVANYFNYKVFAPAGASTSQILKAVPVQADEKGCLADVTSYSFHGEERVDFVPEMAGDGHLYNVPVPWIEYIPVEKTTQVYMQAVNLTREEFLATEDANSDEAVFVGGIKANLVKNNK